MNNGIKKATAIISILSLLITAIPFSTYANSSGFDEFNGDGVEAEVVSGGAIVVEPEEVEEEVTIVEDLFEDVNRQDNKYQIMESVDNIINYEQLSGDLKLTVDCDDTLKGIVIDYESLDTCYYSAVDNVIEIDDEYLNSVSAGLHSMDIEYENGIAIAELNIIEHIVEDDLEKENDVEEKIKINVDEEIETLVWYAGSDEGLTFISDGDASKVENIAVDEKDLTGDMFEVVQKSDNLIEYKINLECLDSLDDGYHDIFITYDNYTVGIKLAVVLNIEEVSQLSGNDTTWQEDWDYNLQLNAGLDGEDLISITRYKGADKSWIIPDKATIGGSDYKTCINIYTPVMDIASITIEGNAYCESLFFTQGISENNTLKSFIAPILDMRKYGNYEMFKGCKVLETLDISNWNTVGVSSINGWFQYCSSLKNIDISGWDLTQVTTMSYLFHWCENLETIIFPDMSNLKVNSTTSMFEGCCKLSNFDVSDFDFSNVDNASNMFSGCYSIIDLDVSEWDTSSLVNARNMFNVRADDKCQLSTLDVSNWDVHNLSNASGMFSGLINLSSIDVSRWDTSNITDTSSMFCNLRLVDIIDISKWDVSKVINMSSMFQHCVSITDLDVSDWDTSNVTNMSSMFSNIDVEVLNISGWNTSSVTNMRYMFGGSGITQLELTSWDVSKVTDMSSMFATCSKLRSLDITGWDVSSLKNINDMFIGLASLVELDLSTLDFSNVNPHNVSDSNRRFISGVHKIITPRSSVSGVVLYHESGGDITFYGYDSVNKKYTDLHSELPSSSKVLYIGEDRWDRTQHTFGTRKVIKQPTPTSTGIAEDTCTVCDLVLAVELPKLEVPVGSYLVEFESNTDTQVESQIVSGGSKVIEPTGLTKTGKVLDGWYTDSSYTNQWNFNKPVTANMTLYAKWADKCTVSFNDGANTIIVDVIQGHKVDEPTKPTKIGNTFKGWFTENTYKTQWDFNNPVESDMTLYAKFDKNSYKVAFDTGDTQDVLYEEKIVKPTDPTKKGHTFKGWFKDTDLTDEWDFDTDVVTGAMTLYAKFDINSYDVTFDTGIGSAVTKQTIQYGNKVTKPATPTNEGFVLKGWFKDSAYTQEWKFNIDVVEDMMTLYAKWIAGYNITLIDSIDDSVIDIIGVEDGDVIDEPEVPEHNGYTFKGWYKSKDGDEEYDWSHGVTEYTTVYSQWYKNPTITLLDFSDGSVIDTIDVKYNGVPIAPEVDPVKSDKEFLGYYVDDSSVSGSNIFSFNRTMTEDINIYCLFAEEVEYTAYGIDDDGNEENRIIAEDTLYKSPIDGDDRYLVNEMLGKGYEILDKSNETIEVFNSGIDSDKMWNITEWLQDATGTPAQYKVISGSAIDFVFVSDDNFPVDYRVYTSLKYQYKVKYNINGLIIENWIPSCSIIEEPDIELDGDYEISGWYTDSGFNSQWDFDSNIVMQPMTLYAKIVDDKGAVVDPSNPTQPTDPSSPSTRPTTPSTGGGGVYYPPTNPTNPPVHQTIKIKAVVDGEDYSIDVSVIDGKTVIATPLKDGHTFDGWYSDEDLTALIDVSELNPYEEVTIYGRFVENKLSVELVKVTFIDDNGNEVFVITLESGDNIDRYVKDLLTVDGLDITVNDYLLQMYSICNGKFKAWMNGVVEWDITESVFGNISLKPVFEMSNSNNVSNIKTKNLIHLKALNTGKEQVCLKWNQVKGAKYYVVYGAKCGTDFNIIGLVNTSKSNNKDSFNYNLYKLDKAIWYKFKVVAYKKYPLKSNSNKFILKKGVSAISKSLAVHTVTTGGKYTNTKAVVIKPEQKNITLNKGKSIVIFATTILNKKNKITKYHCARIRLISSNNVVAIKNNTIVVAKKKGTCKIYVYAQNGKRKVIKVTVK